MIEATSQVRRCDDFGRVFLPISVRQELDILDGCPFEIFIDKEKGQVILQKVGGIRYENYQT